MCTSTHPICRRSKQLTCDSKKQAAELKSRLDTALASQRHLVLQLGRLQAGGGGSSSRVLANACRNAPTPSSGGGASKATQSGALVPGSAELVDGGAEAEPGAAAARRFAAQQERLAATEEQLAAAQQRNMQLEQQLQQQREVTAAQVRELSSLRTQVARGCSLAGDGEWASRAAAAAPECRTGNGSPPTGDQEGISTHRSGYTDGGEGSNATWLRLKYLEARTALERSTASNTQLLRKLESARVQMQQLHEELQHRRAVEQEQEERSHQQEWGPVSHSAQQGVLQDGVDSHPYSNSLEAAALPASSAVGGVHHLRQQLAAANHRAACLEIELDAAMAKLAVYQTQSSCQPEPQLQPQQPPQPPPSEQQQWQQVEQRQHRQQQQLESHWQQQQKHHQWPQLEAGRKPHTTSSQLALHVQAATSTGMQLEDSWRGVLQAPSQRAASPAASKTSGEHAPVLPADED